MQEAVNLIVLLSRESSSFHTYSIHQFLRKPFISATNSQSMNRRCIYHTNII